MDYIFIGKQKWEAVSLSLNEDNGKILGLSAVIAIPDGEGTVRCDIVNPLMHRD